VLEPLPQGDFRVVILNTLVGIRTGPLTLSIRSFDRVIRSVQTIQYVSSSSFLLMCSVRLR